jgi:hypothetical protein
MSQKEVQKRRDVFIEEEKDIYLSFLNKKLRNIRKKLEQIDELSKKDVKTLKPEQIEKINSRPDVVQNIQHFEELKDLYYTAYKTGLEEGKVPLKEGSGKGSDKNTKGEKTGKQTDLSRDEIIRDTIQKVLNLFSFSQSFENPIVKEGLQAEQRTNFENVHQFSQEVLNFRSVERDINERRNESLEKLVSYIKAEDKPAYGESSYKKLQETVEQTLETSTFENIIQAQQEKLNQTQTSQKTEVEVEAKPEPVKETREELPIGAAVLKPDSGDVNISPEKAQYIPKVVRFVDEIEKDMLHTAQIPERADGPEATKGILKESREQGDKNQAEEEREDTNGNQEQKSFRKKRYNDEYGTQPKYYNNGGRPQSNRGGNYPKRGFSGHKENKYEGRNYSKGTYEYKQYVEKKSQEA